MKVIIDNMMNLELLFFAEATTGNQQYRQIAISHADKTMQNHIRADGTPYVVCSMVWFLILIRVLVGRFLISCCRIQCIDRKGDRTENLPGLFRHKVSQRSFRPVLLAKSMRV